jgi:hypothetical protein
MLCDGLCVLSTTTKDKLHAGDTTYLNSRKGEGKLSKPADKIVSAT